MRIRLPHFPLLLCAFACALASCNDEETYADKLKRERKQIEAFMQSGATVKDGDANGYVLNVPGGMKTISESEFEQKGCTTDVSANEYVLFSNTGLYMQIVDKGGSQKAKDAQKNGQTLDERLASGESNNVIVRYTEYSLATATVLTCNRYTEYEMKPDVMHVTNTSGTLSASFLEGLMYTTYSTAAVPTGWLTPLKYVNLARLDGDDATLAHVRLIVPSGQGQKDAAGNIYACFYDITYQKGR